MRVRRIQEFRDPALSSEKKITQDKKYLSYGFTDHRFSIDLWTISKDKCGLTRPAGPNLVLEPLGTPLGVSGNIMGVIHRSFGQKLKGPPQSDFLDAKVENQFKSRPNPKISEQTLAFCAYP